MVLSEIELIKSTDNWLMRDHGFSARDVLVERSLDGEYFVKGFNEFTDQEVYFGELRPSSSVLRLIDEWLDIGFQDCFLAVYSSDYEAVVVDYYHCMGV